MSKAAIAALSVVLSVVLSIGTVPGQAPTRGGWLVQIQNCVKQYGFLTVVVKDQSGAKVTGARVEIVDDSSRSKQRFKSDQSGALQTQTLKPGMYTVSVSYPGFADLTKTVKLSPSTNFTFEAELGISPVDCKRQSNSRVDGGGLSGED